MALPMFPMVRERLVEQRHPKNKHLFSDPETTSLQTPPAIKVSDSCWLPANLLESPLFSMAPLLWTHKMKFDKLSWIIKQGDCRTQKMMFGQIRTCVRVVRVSTLLRSLRYWSYHNNGLSVLRNRIGKVYVRGSALQVYNTTRNQQDIPEELADAEEVLSAVIKEAGKFV